MLPRFALQHLTDRQPDSLEALRQVVLGDAVGQRPNLAHVVSGEFMARVSFAARF
jgi:hypothetical protein